MSFSAAERETVIQTDDESGKWELHTYQSKIQTKLRKLGIEALSTTDDGGAKYELDFNQVSFRSGKKRTGGTKKPMSEEHKQKMKEGRKKKNGTL